MKKIKHCLPLISSSVHSIESKIESVTGYDYFEIWLDYLPDNCVNAISELCNKYPDQIILLNRRLGLEAMTRSLDGRLEIIRSLKEAPCIFDFDIHAQREELDLVTDEGFALKTILSYHNYTQTPSDEYLENVLEEMHAYSPWISKLACFCESAADGIRLLACLERQARTRAVIVLGMGIHGLPTRVFGCELGNEFTFSPIERKGESAPGQLTHGELNEIVEVLNNAG